MLSKMSQAIYLMFDGACSIVHVISTRQQVQDRTIPLQSDVMALLSLVER